MQATGFRKQYEIHFARSDNGDCNEVVTAVTTQRVRVCCICFALACGIDMQPSLQVPTSWPMSSRRWMSSSLSLNPTCSCYQPREQNFLWTSQFWFGWPPLAYVLVVKTRPPNSQGWPSAVAAPTRSHSCNFDIFVHAYVLWSIAWFFLMA